MPMICHIYAPAMPPLRADILFQACYVYVDFFAIDATAAPFYAAAADTLRHAYADATRLIRHVTRFTLRRAAAADADARRCHGHARRHDLMPLRYLLIRLRYETSCF